MIARVGIIAAIASFVIGALLTSYPFTFSTSAWYFLTGLVGLAVVVALSTAAFRIAAAPRGRRSEAEARG